MRYLFAAVCLALTGVCHADEPDRTKLAAIPKAMEKFVEDQHLSGAVTVVGTSKGVLSLDAVGKQYLDGPAMPKDAVFRIASMTKPMVAVAVLILADEGKLKVDDPV